MANELQEWPYEHIDQLKDRVTELEAERDKLRKQYETAWHACRAVTRYPGSMDFLGTQIYDRCMAVVMTPPKEQE